MPDPKPVYIIDDDVAVRQSLSFFLSTAGFSPTEYSDGRQFLDDAASLQPGAVLLDIRMPHIDGLQLIERLDDRLTKLPVIFMTGHGDVQSVVRAMKLGATDFIEKPFSETAVLEMLERVFLKLDEQALELQKKAEAVRLVKSLTPRETEVLRGLIDGRSNKVLAYDLGLSNRTVEMHRANMMTRLGVRTLSDALKIAFSAELTSL